MRRSQEQEPENALESVRRRLSERRIAEVPAEAEAGVVVLEPPVVEEAPRFLLGSPAMDLAFGIAGSLIPGGLALLFLPYESESYYIFLNLICWGLGIFQFIAFFSFYGRYRVLQKTVAVVVALHLALPGLVYAALAFTRISGRYIGVEDLHDGDPTPSWVYLAIAIGLLLAQLGVLYTAFRKRTR